MDKKCLDFLDQQKSRQHNFKHGKDSSPEAKRALRPKYLVLEKPVILTGFLNVFTFSGWPLVGNEGPSTFTLVYWGFIPSFPTKGQLVFAPQVPPIEMTRGKF